MCFLYNHFSKKHMTLLHFVLALLLVSIVAADECTDLNVTACAALQSKGCDFCHSGGSCDFCGACFNVTTSTCCSAGGCEFVGVCTSGSSCCWPEGGECYHCAAPTPLTRTNVLELNVHLLQLLGVHGVLQRRRGLLPRYVQQMLWKGRRLLPR